MTATDVLTVLVPALTALVGAWVGARLAFQRVTKERAFDRRLEWYEEMHSAIQAVSQALKIGKGERRFGGTSSVPSDLAAIADAIQQMELVSRSAALYASPAAVSAVATALREAGEVTRGLKERFTSLDKENAAQFLKALADYNTPLDAAARVLAEDVRRHLHLGSLGGRTV